MKLIKCFLLFSMMAGATELPSYMQNVQSPEDIITNKKLYNFERYYSRNISKHWMEVKKDKSLSLTETHRKAFNLAMEEYGLLKHRREIENFFMAVLLGSDSEQQKLSAVKVLARFPEFESENKNKIQKLIDTGKTNDLTLTGIYQLQPIMNEKFNFPSQILRRIYRYKISEYKKISIISTATIGKELIDSTDKFADRFLYSNFYIDYCNELIKKEKKENLYQLMLDIAQGLDVISSNSDIQKNIITYQLSLLKKSPTDFQEFEHKYRMLQTVRLKSFFKKLTKSSFEYLDLQYRVTKDLDTKIAIVCSLSANEFKNHFKEVMGLINETEFGSLQHLALVDYLISSTDKRGVSYRVETAESLKDTNISASKDQYLHLSTIAGLNLDQSMDYDFIRSSIRAWWDKNKDKPEYHYNPK